MSETSMNGWPASTTLKTRPMTVNGITFTIADNDDLEVVFRHLVEQYAARVQTLVPGHCFGFNYRANVNNPSLLSNHSSGTALDINSVEHPNGVDASKTFTALQIAEVHQVLAEIPELSTLVHWGGDWHAPSLTPDAMHFELHQHDLALLKRVADYIRTHVQEDDMPLNDADKTWLQQTIKAEVSAALDASVNDVDQAKVEDPHGGDPKSMKLGVILYRILRSLARIESAAKTGGKP